MTARAYAFPRIDVREAPPRAAATLSAWREDWRRACARAAAVNDLPSAYQGIARTIRASTEVRANRNEQRRRIEAFTYEGES